MTPQETEAHIEQSPPSRPCSLPGLIAAPDRLAKLAGNVILASPKASTEVKEYAMTLVQELITGTMGEAIVASKGTDNST